MVVNDYSIKRIEELVNEVNQLKGRLERYEGDGVIAVQVWQRADIEVALADNGFAPSEDNIDLIISSGVVKILEDASHGNDSIAYVVHSEEDKLKLQDED